MDFIIFMSGRRGLGSSTYSSYSSFLVGSGQSVIFLRGAMLKNKKTPLHLTYLINTNTRKENILELKREISNNHKKKGKRNNIN